MIISETINEKIFGLKHLFYLFLPIALMTFSTNLFPAVEKVLLASLSARDMEASIGAFYAVQIFQLASVSLAMMAQVFIGSWYGEKKWEKIGPGIWQFIWFSILSLIITLPAGYLYGNFYFKGTPLEDIVFPYYYFLLLISFLFPLGTTLTCFFLGQGRTWIIFLTTLIFQLIKLPIGYILIFGWNWIPSFGLMGGAYSIFITQLGFCLVLFIVFFSKKNHQIFRTREWAFNISFFWECVHPGILRAISRLCIMACWGAVTYLLAKKGGDYLLILSIGGTLSLFVTFFADAICTLQMTIVSQLIGSKNLNYMHTAFQTGLILAIIITCILSINLIIFPNWTFFLLFPNINLDPSEVRIVLMGVWISSAFFILSYLPISYILAFKDTYFSLLMALITWVTGFCFIFVFINFLEFSAAYFWLLWAFPNFINTLLYYWRMKWLIGNLKHNPTLI